MGPFERQVETLTEVFDNPSEDVEWRKRGDSRLGYFLERRRDPVAARLRELAATV